MSTGDDVIERLFGVRGKVVLVTGGSRGIGRMIAEGFVRAGARTYISARKVDELATAEAELRQLGDCTALQADLSSEAGCQALAEAVAGREQQLHVLVNNAGANWGAPFDTYDAKAWDRVLDVNVKGVFLLTRALRPLLDAAAGEGDPARVINIGSIDGLSVPRMETWAYSSSKAAVHHLTRHLALTLAPTATVNAVAPGPFESKMMKATLDAFGDAIAKGAPMKRIGEPDDMAGVALYLASKAGAYVTGAVIPVDGGITIGR